MTAARAGLVSCVIIFLDAEQFLDDAIASVFAQRHDEWELILVNDGSTDRSGAIAQAWVARDPSRVRYLEHPDGRNHGMSASRNRGMSVARGEFVAFLDADDMWLPEKLEEQVAIMESHPEIGMVCGATLLWRSWNVDENEDTVDRVMHPGADWNGQDAEGLYRDEVVPAPTLAVTLSPLGERSCPSTSNFLFRRSVAERVDGFVESFRDLGEDQVFQTKVFLDYPVFVSTRVWDRVRMHPDSCVARAAREGRLRNANRVLLDWIAEYLRAGEYMHGDVARAFDRAEWPFRHPVRHRVRESAAFVRALPGRVVRKIAREVRRYRDRSTRPATSGGTRRAKPITDP